MHSWARLSAKLLGAYNRSSEIRKGTISRDWGSQGWGSWGGFLERVVWKVPRFFTLPEEDVYRWARSFVTTV